MNKKKPKATGDEANNQVQELWAQFGELSAQQEILQSQLQQIRIQRRELYSRIMKLKNDEAEE